MTIKKIQVKVTQEYYGDFEGSFESIIASLQSELDAGWEGLQKKWEPYCDCPTYHLYKHREETDKEYEKRLKQLEKEKVEKEKAKERKLAQLKKDLASLDIEEWLTQLVSENYDLDDYTDEEILEAYYGDLDEAKADEGLTASDADKKLLGL